MRDTEPPPSWRGGDGYDESAVTAQIEEPLSHYALKNFCLWFRSKAQIVFSNWAVDLDYGLFGVPLRSARKCKHY